MMARAREERKISLLDTIIMATMILVRMTTMITNYPRAKERAERDPRATMMMMARAREERKISLLDTIIMATMILVRMTTTITTRRDPRAKAARDPRETMTMMARASQERDPRRATLPMIDTINLRCTITVSKNL